jgi:hypothetical protein
MTAHARPGRCWQVAEPDGVWESYHHDTEAAAEQQWMRMFSDHTADALYEYPSAPDDHGVVRYAPLPLAEQPPFRWEMRALPVPCLWVVCDGCGDDFWADLGDPEDYDDPHPCHLQPDQLVYSLRMYGWLNVRGRHVCRDCQRAAEHELLARAAQ